jgi:tRNA A22 N-methylase
MERSGISKVIRKLVPNLIATRNLQPDKKFESRQKIGTAKISGLGAARINEIFEKLK